jgi:hypothetical protein
LLMHGIKVKYMPTIAGRRANMEYVDALKELEHPPHRGVDARLPYLVRDALPTLGQALPEIVQHSPDPVQLPGSDSRGQVDLVTMRKALSGDRPLAAIHATITR